MWKISTSSIWARQIKDVSVISEAKHVSGNLMEFNQKHHSWDIIYLPPWILGKLLLVFFLGAVPLFHSIAHTLSLLHHSLTCLEMFPFDFISEEFLNT